MRLAVTGPLILEDDTMMIQAAKDGTGIAYVYDEMAREFIAQGQRVEILEDWKALPSRFFIQYSNRHHVPPALQALIEFVRETQHQ